MSLYPSLEDMKIGQMMQAQMQPQSAQQPNPPYPNLPFSSIVPQQVTPYPTAPAFNPQYSALDSAYPALSDMGLALTPDEIAMITAPVTRESGAMMVQGPREMAPVMNVGNNQMIAPISGQSLGLYRAQVTHGIREVTLCKGTNGLVGMRVQAVSKVCLHFK